MKEEPYSHTNSHANSAIFKRFWRATLISHSKLKTELIEPEKHEKLDFSISNEEIYEILDKKYDSSHNLENIEDLKPKHKLYKCFHDILSQIKSDKIIISLSGGVDSMVCSFILYHYCKHNNKELIAIHIDYGNRDTCKIEVEFVKRWCLLLNIKLYVRHIEYLRRDRSHDRDIYEEVTRQIRFQMYKRFNCPVVLGHNRDDCEENIFTNIRKARNLDCLKGMKKIGEESGVTTLRPLLDIPKSEIYEFASYFEIPHLYDSTPDWSDRGKMRNELIPFLNKFDAAFLSGLICLSETYEKLYLIYKTSVLDNFLSKLYYGEMITVINFEEVDEKCLEYGYQFWKDIVYHIVKINGLDIPRNKSIRFLAKRLEEKKYGKIFLSLYFVAEYSKDELIFLICSKLCFDSLDKEKDKYKEKKKLINY